MSGQTLEYSAQGWSHYPCRCSKNVTGNSAHGLAGMVMLV